MKAFTSTIAFEELRMTERPKNEKNDSRNLADNLRDGLAVILAIVFIALYAAAFAGKLDPLKDSTMLMRIEPVIFILIGFIFARIPQRNTERALSAEIGRQTQRADAAQFAKETAMMEREVIEERLKNVRIALESGESKSTTERSLIRILES
jgi:hypothetical protein